MLTDLGRSLHRLQTTSVAPPVNEGEKVYVYDSETLLPAYDTPRFAPLRALLSNLAQRNRTILWSEKHHVIIPSGGRGKPELKIWVKKNKSDATSDVWMADFRFRFDESKSSAGFSIEALRTKLGDITCAEAGLEWLVVADAQPQTHGIIQGAESQPFIIAVRDDELFDTDLWLYLDEMNKAWGLLSQSTVDNCENFAAHEAAAQDVEVQEVDAQEVDAQDVEAQDVEASPHPSSDSPEAAPPVRDFATSSAINKAKRALDDLDASIKKAQDVSKHLRSLMHRFDS